MTPPARRGYGAGMSKILSALAVALMTVTLGGCGGEDDADPKAAASEAVSEAVEEMFAVPACDDVATIGEDFEGCEEDGSLQAAIEYDCDDGRALIASGSVFGFVGEEAVRVPDAGDSPEFAEAMSECRP